jgi:hypothetical protein
MKKLFLIFAVFALAGSPQAFGAAPGANSAFKNITESYAATRNNNSGKKNTIMDKFSNPAGLDPKIMQLVNKAMGNGPASISNTKPVAEAASSASSTGGVVDQNAISFLFRESDIPSDSDALVRDCAEQCEKLKTDGIYYSNNSCQCRLEDQFSMSPKLLPENDEYKKYLAAKNTKEDNDQNATEACIKDILKTASVSTDNKIICSDTEVTLSEKRALEVSSNWTGGADAKYYGRTNNIDEHEKDACYVIERLKTKCKEQALEVFDKDVKTAKEAYKSTTETLLKDAIAAKAAADQKAAEEKAAMGKNATDNSDKA